MRTRLGEQIEPALLTPLRELWQQLGVGRYYAESEWDIMTLREDKLYVPREPVMTYGKQELLPDVATWHFTSTTKLIPTPNAERMVSYYVDDRDLAGVWSAPFRHAAEWIIEKVAGVVMPNFSVYSDYRIAERLSRRDKAFAIGRFWQEAGLQVLPDLEWGDEIDLDWFDRGLPKNVPAIMLQAQRGARSKNAITEWFNTGVPAIFKDREIGTVFLYCSSRVFEQLSEPYRDRARWVHVPTYREIRRGQHG